ncbi:nuclear-pore anchor-like isoform X2 [Glycine soja]|uniref:nuclear-pore anchor-like isoform X2 n=1 Tax=Glycine soja TaxID=3848 RepID=UPI00103983E1|nr:nuclear-pore anchor-like isoform X2 [Glycine soja]XP_028192650.1 nuclear-pore anchor-like isoform X2 [Glycine soja]XP_028194663.1 nuclear-pore anchor-like isoform X2 [Glycine soja]
MEKDNLNKKVSELLERSKNVDVEDYDRVKKLAREIQDKLRERDARIEELGKSLSEKQDSVSCLEKDLPNCRLELAETEKRINDILHNEANLKLDSEKHRKLLAQFKRIDVLSRKKEHLGKENQQLSRQLDEIKQGKLLF